jgi:hypothetical protein
MKMLNKVVPALILPLISSALVADTEFGDSVPREVVNQLLGDPLRGGMAQIYSDILDTFPDFEVPDGFAVLASADQPYFQRVILKTDADEEPARRAALAAFTGNGWQELPVYGSGVPQTGFVNTVNSPQSTTVCNDAFGRISISVSEGGAPRYVSLNYNTNGPNVNGREQSCAEQAEMMTQGPMGMRMQRGPQLQQYIPRLVMPQSTSAPRGGDLIAFNMGGGGGNDEWETRGTVSVDWSIDAIAQYFVEQIEEQGWAADSEVTGSVAASGSWTKTIDDMELVGTLMIVRQAENTWDLRFKILRQVELGTAAAPRFFR